jgi:hypothetical protein
MDVIKMLQELRSEREQVEEAILALERLVSGRGRRRGRPPKWLSESSGAKAGRADSPTPRKKRVLSPEARARRATGQRKRWPMAGNAAAAGGKIIDLDTNWLDLPRQTCFDKLPVINRRERLIPLESTSFGRDPLQRGGVF